MALRVLLADESTTIKKVMQLALQDFAVEVKAVHAGVDVLEVARSFQPDLIFADVLLQKKNGYEVCGLLKADSELKSIPVILMWSSFMDLDDALAKASGADARLEKPFDVETLRKQVLELVPKTRSQRLAHFLEYPQKLNEELKGDAKSAAPQSAPQAANQPPTPSQTPAPKAAAPRPVAPPVQAPVAAPKPPTPPPPEAPSTWSMASFDDPANFEATSAGTSEAEDEEFKPLELSQLGQNPNASSPFETVDPQSDYEPASFESQTDSQASNEFAPVPGDDEVWARQDLSQFKLDLPPISVGEGGDTGENFNIDLGDQEFSRPDFRLSDQAPPRRNSDLALDIDEINTAPEIALPLEPTLETFESSLESFESPFESTFENTREPIVPQLSADRLEAIIRAQSREIIEQVVRKMVPELASTIIREELERLLEDTAVKDPRL